jgi:hypothetical protein
LKSSTLGGKCGYSKGTAILAQNSVAETSSQSSNKVKTAREGLSWIFHRKNIRQTEIFLTVGVPPIDFLDVIGLGSSSLSVASSLKLVLEVRNGISFEQLLPLRGNQRNTLNATPPGGGLVASLPRWDDMKTFCNASGTLGFLPVRAWPLSSRIIDILCFGGSSLAICESNFITFIQ